MLYFIRFALVAFALGVGPIPSARACTTVSIPKSFERVVAKSYDWDQDSGMLVANLRGLEKTAFTLKPLDRPAKWTAKYGSLSFNQYGREFPLGGVNEKGLTVEIMWLNSAEYPAFDLRPTVNESQWIQYQLDNFATTAEAVTAADKIRVSKVYADVHYLVCDSGGACATFEYLKGKLVIHSGATLSVPALANNTYEEHVQHWALFTGPGASRGIPTDSSSLSRFVRASLIADQFDPHGTKPAVELGFEVLDSVRASNSVFNIVYESASGRAHFRTQSYPTIKFAQIADFDLQCSRTQEKTMVFDLNQNLIGDVRSEFTAYTEAENRRLIDIAFKDKEKDLPSGVKEKVITYPSKHKCQ